MKFVSTPTAPLTGTGPPIHPGFPPTQFTEHMSLPTSWILLEGVLKINTLLPYEDIHVLLQTPAKWKDSTDGHGLSRVGKERLELMIESGKVGRGAKSQED